jgi:hypothetical protein
VEEYKVENDMMTALCTGCHSPGECAEKQVPEFGLHPKGFLIPPEGVPGQPVISFEMLKDEFPIFTPAGDIAESGNIVCSTCHNPHQWDPRANKKGPGKNTEGSACDSFLRPRLDAQFCTLCHGDKGILMFKYFTVTWEGKKGKERFRLKRQKDSSQINWSNGAVE